MILSFFHKNIISSFFIFILMMPVFITVALPRKAEAIPVAVIVDAVVTAYESAKVFVQTNTMIQSIITAVKAAASYVKEVAIQINTALTEYHQMFQQFKEEYLDPITKYMSALMSNMLVKMMYNYIATGHSGGPAFLTNPLDFFSGVAKESTQVFLTDLETASGKMLPMIRDLVNGKLINETYLYAQKMRQSTFPCLPEKGKPCPIEKRQAAYIAYIENGKCPTVNEWDCYFALLKPENDPHAVGVFESDQLTKKRMTDVKLAQDQIQAGSGFHDMRDCITKDKNDNCTKYVTKTAGTILAHQANLYLGNALAYLQSADELGELLTQGLSDTERFLNGGGMDQGNGVTTFPLPDQKAPPKDVPIDFNGQAL